ncbi:MAG: hypothetical protein ACJATA_001382 [Sphingobacteriales bacterium]|jgi:hypothetical protein
MKTYNFETLSQATTHFHQAGYKENFKAIKGKLVALGTGKGYAPHEVVFTDTVRFEGMSDPADSTQLYCVRCNDNTLGTLVMAYGAEENQDAEVLKAITVEKS